MTDSSARGLPAADEILLGSKGRDEPVRLEAGALSAEFVGGVLRYLRYGETEVVRRVMVAVRDAAWNTVPAELTDVVITNGERGFAVTFNAHNASGDLDVAWRGAVTGSSDGSCEFRMDAEARSAFDFRRIGLCVLHPIGEFAGKPYSAGTGDASFDGCLPELVAPPESSAGEFIPLVPGFEWLTLTNGLLQVRFSFSGDLFELEDQRNWTDASFKSYSRFPVPSEAPEHASVGMRFTQTVAIAIEGPVVSRPADLALGLSFGEDLELGLPMTGISCSPDQPPSPRLSELLSHLNPAHLRVDVHLSDAWKDRLKNGVEEAARLGRPLELALFLANSTRGQLERLATALSGVAIVRILVYSEDSATTTVLDLSLARAVLADSAPGVPIGGGSDLNFAELNEHRPDAAEMDVVAFPITPQVHASDESSMVETPEAVRTILRTGRGFCGGRPIAVTPISLRPRYNPDSTQDIGATSDAPPDNVDPRQGSLFASVWTLATMKALAEGGASSTTWYETFGARGLAVEAPPPLGSAGTAQEIVYPIYHVLRDFTELQGTSILACHSDDPLQVEAIALRSARGKSILVANMQPICRTVTLRFAPHVSLKGALVRRLNTDTAPIATSDPDRFRHDTGPIAGELDELDLLPYEYLRLDLL